jgi:hypothetical protein
MFPGRVAKEILVGRRTTTSGAHPLRGNPFKGAPKPPGRRIPGGLIKRGDPRRRDQKKTNALHLSMLRVETNRDRGGGVCRFR